jgi:hypothetical protein
MLMSAYLGFISFRGNGQNFLDNAMQTEAGVVSLSMLAIEKSHTIGIRILAANILAHHSEIGRGLHMLRRDTRRDLPTTGYSRQSHYFNMLAGLESEQFDQVVLHDLGNAIEERNRLFANMAHRRGNSLSVALALSVLPGLNQDAAGVRRLLERLAPMATAQAGDDTVARNLP